MAETLHERGMVVLSHRGLHSTVEGRDYAQAAAGHAEPVLADSYVISKDGVDLDVRIAREEGCLKYILCRPVFQKPTKAVLDSIFDGATPACSSGQVRGRADFEAVKDSLRSCMRARVDERLDFVDAKLRALMVCELGNELHLGPIEYLLCDPHVEEIKAKGGGPVFVKNVRCNQEWVETNIVLEDDAVSRYIRSIARETSQQIDASHPLMDAVLHTGDRVNACMPQTAGGSHMMEIRVFSKMPWSIVRLIRRGTVSPEIVAYLWLAIQCRLNVLVSGETGSGKTSFLNALGVFLPRNDHIVSIEDTRELQLPDFFKNWSHMTSRVGDGAGGISMSRLLVNALRMDPSFILMGEVRSREDIEALMRATAMGHPVMSTIHTKDCQTTVKRFRDSGVSPSDLCNIHLNVILEAVRVGGGDPQRRVKEVGEYHHEGGDVEVSRIFRLDVRTDEFAWVNEPRGFFRRISDRTGRGKAEVLHDIDCRKRVIEWLVACGVEDNQAIGALAQAYHRDPQAVLKAASSGCGMREVLGDG